MSFPDSDKIFAAAAAERTKRNHLISQIRDKVEVMISLGKDPQHPLFKIAEQKTRDTITIVDPKSDPTSPTVLAIRFDASEEWGPREDGVVKEDTLFGKKEDEPRGLRVIEIEGEMPRVEGSIHTFNREYQWSAHPDVVDTCLEHFRIKPINIEIRPTPLRRTLAED